MKQARLHRHLPHPPQAIYDLIHDISSYPIIFPLVKSAQVISQAASHKMIRLEFDLPKLVPLANPFHITRVTGQAPHRIEAKKSQSPLKALDLRWDLKPGAQGGTDMTFQMDYELGLGFLADAFIETRLPGLLDKAMTRFESHAAQMIKPAPSPVSRRPRRTPGSP